MARKRSTHGGVLARLSDPRDTVAAVWLAGVLLVAEAGLGFAIIRRVAYTEVDWGAYMEIVEGYMQGERDYLHLKGGTGPAVYPAGFMYIFSALRWVTGGAILPAQIAFEVLYLATQAVVMASYISTKALPPWSLVLLCLSRRLHSIYLLRLFNDCWAMFFAYAGILALQHKKWTPAVLLFSAGVSIKMNVLLMAPGVLAAFIKGARVQQLVPAVAVGAALQLILGAPFLLTFPQSYLARAFEFSRVFVYQWTVNLKFLPESWFTSPQLALFLLAVHLRLLWSLAQHRWFAPEGGISGAVGKFFQRSEAAAHGRSPELTPESVLYFVATANFMGILCARTLHYQFYSWYWHTLPYLLMRSTRPVWVTVPMLLSIEALWNIFPSTPVTSALLLVLHLAVATFCFQDGRPLPAKTIRKRPNPRR